MRPSLRWRATAVLLAAGLTTSARADPPLEVVSPDVTAAAHQMAAGAKEGRVILDRLARSGRADAAELLGEMFQFGQGVPPDRKAACEYFAMASGKRGDSTHNLAYCYEEGAIGAGPDLARAAQLYEQAAGLGVAKSNCALGNLYADGRGVPKDPLRGLALCLLAAEAGDADAQADVGDFYLHATGVPKDAVKARSWYEKAVVQKHANAAHTLGQIYWFGDGVQKDNLKAAELWRLAWDGGRIDAAYQLGNEAFARAGRGEKVWDPAGLDEAADWYGKAVDAPDPDVRKLAVERRDLCRQLAGIMRRRK